MSKLIHKLVHSHYVDLFRQSGPLKQARYWAKGWFTCALPSLFRGNFTRWKALTYLSMSPHSGNVKILGASAVCYSNPSLTELHIYRVSQKKLWIVNYSPLEILTIPSNIIAPQDPFLFSCVTNCINFRQFPPENCPFYAPWDPLHPIMECMHLSAECMYNKCIDNQISTFWRVKQACKRTFFRG